MSQSHVVGSRMLAFVPLKFLPAGGTSLIGQGSTRHEAHMEKRTVVVLNLGSHEAFCLNNSSYSWIQLISVLCEIHTDGPLYTRSGHGPC